MPKLTTYNVLIGVIVAIGTFGYGYGFGVFITSIGQPGFYVDFDLDRKFRCALKNTPSISDLDISYEQVHREVRRHPHCHTHNGERLTRQI